MPSTYAPTHYERSKGIEGQPYDSFFKWTDADWWVDSTGDVNSPLGYVVLIEVDQNLIDSYVEATDDRDFYPEVGWYVTRLDENGLIWAMTYGTGTMAEEGARADFAEAEKVYAEWDDPDQSESDEPEGGEDDPCLVCLTCGEAFDELKAASDHGCASREFEIQPRSEAF